MTRLEILNSVIDKAFLGPSQLISSFSGHNDPNRQQMFDAQLRQIIIPKHAEIPKTPSIYSRELLKYSSKNNIKKLKNDSIYLGEFILGGEEHVLILDTETKILELFNISDKIVGEYFGTYNEQIIKKENLEIGQPLNKNQVIQRLNISDKNGNLKLGVNAKVIYSVYGYNYQDGYLISDRFAEKLTHKEIKEITFVVNYNEILLNKYGNSKKYKCFPDIGEFIDYKNRILCAKRKMIKSWESISLLSNDDVREIFFDSDEVFYGPKDSKVKSIVVYENLEEEHDAIVKESDFYKSISKYIDNTYNNIKSFIGTIHKYYNPKKKKMEYNLSSDLHYFYNKYKKILEKKNLHYKEKPFRGFFVKIRLESEYPAKLGSKITNFHAGKGCLNNIIPYQEMPKIIGSKDEYADIICSPNSVIGRANIGQIYEVHLTDISEKITNKIRNENLSEQKFLSLYLNTMKHCLPVRIYFQIKENMEKLDSKELNKFIKDITKNGLIIPQVPFESISFQMLRKLYKKFSNGLTKIEVNGKVLKQEVLAGELYVFKLKHEPSKKITFTNIKKIGTKTLQPSKGSTDYKNNKAINTHTPNTIGEQETALCTALPSNSLLKEWVFLKSSDDVNRKKFLNSLLTNDGEIKLSDFDRLESVGVKNLRFYLNVLGLKTKRNE